jgi:hypothetical protein
MLCQLSVSKILQHIDVYTQTNQIKSELISAM